MTQITRIALAQVPHARSESSPDFLALRMRTTVARHPGFGLWVFPEFHLDPDGAHADPRSSARPLDDPSFDPIAEIAREFGIWLIPGSFYERGADPDAFHNTAVVYSPAGERIAAYRKMFPWRPRERSRPGEDFTLFDIPGVGRVGLSICYDIWFPEHTRHVAWMGADLIVNLVQTATSDREQELAIVRGNAIMNQVWIASVNASVPSGRGRSTIVSPSGTVIAESPDGNEEILTAVIDLAATRTTQREGTAGVTRPWSQLEQTDAAITLPLYDGSLETTRWTPDRAEVDA